MRLDRTGRGIFAVLGAHTEFCDLVGQSGTLVPLSRAEDPALIPIPRWAGSSLELMPRKPLKSNIMLRTFFAFTAVALALPVAEASAQQAQCPIFVPPEETLGETFLCGKIDVPENWSAPDGKTIGISYVILRSDSLAPFPDPVIYFQGGPGGSALNSLPIIGGGTSGLRANRDVIIVEQRGTAHSNDLYCPMSIRAPSPDTYDEDLAAADERINALGINAYSDPDEVYDAIAAYAEIKDYRSCVPYLEDRGNDLSQYSTASTVQDVISLMQSLGYPAYNLFGGSYGTTVTLAIMDHYEKNPNAGLPPLRSAVIDGVAPRNKEFYEEAFIKPWAVLRAFEGCESSAACAAAYPDIRARAVQLLEALQVEPLPREDGEAVTMDGVADVLRSAVTSQQKLVPYLPRLVDELERGEFAVYDLAQAAIRYEVTLPDATMQPEAPEPEGIAAIQSQMDTIEDQFDAIKESLSLILLSDGIIKEAALEASSPADLFLAIYDKFLEVGGGSIGNIVVSKLEPFALHPERRTRAGLMTFINESVPMPTLQSELRLLAERLSDEDIRLIFWRLTNYTFERGLAVIDSITHRVVRCNDEARGFFNDVAFEVYQTFEVPQLIDDWAYFVANYQVSCIQLGLAAEEYAPPLSGVVSDVPTLVVNGALDTATPAEWGFRAAETLTNAKVVTIPMAGHVAGLMTPCGKALIQAFILSPDTELNEACIADLRPRFVLPEEELPT